MAPGGVLVLIFGFCDDHHPDNRETGYRDVLGWMMMEHLTNRGNAFCAMLFDNQVITRDQFKTILNTGYSTTKILCLPIINPFLDTPKKIS